MTDIAVTSTATPAQHRLMHLLWSEAGLTDRDSRLWVTSLWLGRNIESSRSLSRHDASVVIDLLLTADIPAVDDVDDDATTYDPEEDLF